MGEVIEFPNREVQALAFLDQQLRELLQAKGADEALIGFAIETLRSVYGEITETSDVNIRLDLPAMTTIEETERMRRQIDEGIDIMRREHHDMMVQLASRLVLAELKLFQKQRDEGQ